MTAVFTVGIAKLLKTRRKYQGLPKPRLAVGREQRAKHYAPARRRHIAFQPLLFHRGTGTGIESPHMVAQVSERLEEKYDIEPIGESNNVSVSESDLENDSKGQLIKLAGKLRDRRNDLNQKASRRATLRDELNAETREKVDEAQEHREKRDELNDEVQEHKQQRNELNARANELFDEVENKKAELEIDDGDSVDELKSEIEDLEFKQQTEVLDPDDERELIEKIDDKREKLQKKQEKLDDTGDIDDLRGEAEAVREEASEHHEKVTQLADEAQEHHNRMIEAYRAADEIRDTADEVHELFVKAQELADRHHEDFVRVQKRLRELDKEEDEQRRTEREKEKEEAKQEAEEIYQKFKDGETLETEDLMKLQKAGLL